MLIRVILILQITMGVEIKFSQSYFWLNSWILGNIIQLGTQSFCDRFINYHIDPGRRLYDQMVLAARCGVANIAEGSARKSTSIETEMKLLDVARASFDEVQGDFFNFVLRSKKDVWALGDPNREAIWRIELDQPRYSNSLLHDAAKHILNQKQKYDFWIENDVPEIAANAMLILCVRINKMLHSQLNVLLEQFRQHGGFSENMTAERLEARRRQAVTVNAPNCPKCGKTMLRRMQNRGRMQGREFWGCSDYPNCTGILPIHDKR